VLFFYFVPDTTRDLTGFTYLVITDYYEELDGQYTQRAIAEAKQHSQRRKRC
jgi:hypothetical protein